MICRTSIVSKNLTPNVASIYCRIILLRSTLSKLIHVCSRTSEEVRDDKRWIAPLELCRKAMIQLEALQHAIDGEHTQKVEIVEQEGQFRPIEDLESYFASELPT
eukprot:IDg11177t1